MLLSVCVCVRLILIVIVIWTNGDRLDYELGRFSEYTKALKSNIFCKVCATMLFEDATLVIIKTKLRLDT